MRKRNGKNFDVELLRMSLRSLVKRYAAMEKEAADKAEQDLGGDMWVWSHADERAYRQGKAAYQLVLELIDEQLG